MITDVAIKEPCGKIWSLPKPNRHGDVISLIRSKQNTLQECVCGFLDDKGTFLTRRDAWHEAYRCNQLLPPYNPVNPNQRTGKPNNTPGDLFSEDIW